MNSIKSESVLSKMTNSWTNCRQATPNTVCRQHHEPTSETAEKKRINRHDEQKQHKSDEAVFTALIACERASLSGTVTCSAELSKTMILNNSMASVRATVRNWAETLWSNHHPHLFLFVSKNGDIPVSLSSQQINGTLVISVACADPAFLERMKQNRAELDRKLSRMKVQVEFLASLPAGNLGFNLDDTPHEH